MIQDGYGQTFLGMNKNDTNSMRLGLNISNIDEYGKMKLDFLENMKTRPVETVTKENIRFYLIKSPKNLQFDPDIL